MTEKQRTVCENCGWKVDDDTRGNITLSQFSPAGEDFSFDVDSAHFVENVKDYAAHFDVDTHIEMWAEARISGRTDVPSIRRLAVDAEEIDKMLQELAAALARAEEKQC